MTPCVVNRNLKKVLLLPYDPATKELYITVYGDTIVRWITGPIQRVEQGQGNKIDHASVNTDNQK